MEKKNSEFENETFTYKMVQKNSKIGRDGEKGLNKGSTKNYVNYDKLVNKDIISIKMEL